MCTRVAHVQPAVKRPRLIRKLDATGHPEPMLREKCTRSSDKKKETSFTTNIFTRMKLDIEKVQFRTEQATNGL